MDSERDTASRRASREFVQQEMDNLKQFKRLSIGQLSSIQDPDLPSANSYHEAKTYEKNGNTLWVPASVHPEVSPNEWKSFVKTRIKRDSTGSRLSQIISDEGDLKDGTAVLERKRQSVDFSSRRQSIVDMVTAFESQKLDRPVVKEAGVELRRSGASSRRQRPVLRKHEGIERRASESERSQRPQRASVTLERNHSMPERTEKPLPPQKRGNNLRIDTQDANLWHLESHHANDHRDHPSARERSEHTSPTNGTTRLGHQRSLPSLPTKSPSPPPGENSSSDTRENSKSFWRWRKEKDATSPTAKTFSSLFKRKKDRNEPPTPDREEHEPKRSEDAEPRPAVEPVEPAEPIEIEPALEPGPEPVLEPAFGPEQEPARDSNSAEPDEPSIQAGFPGTPKRGIHQRSNSQVVSRHEVNQLQGKPEKEGSAASSEELQLPYQIPAHQISDRSYIMMYHRFPLHIERAIYRFSHMKLANPRRPLREQVLLSNFMYSYLNLINQGYQQQMEQQALAENPHDEQTGPQTSPQIGPRGTSQGAGPDYEDGMEEEELEKELEEEEEGRLNRGYGYQDYDFEFYQAEESSSSSSSDSEVEEMWDPPAR